MKDEKEETDYDSSVVVCVLYVCNRLQPVSGK